MKIYVRKLVVLLLCFLTAASMLPVTVLARSGVDVSAETSLQVVLPIEGMTVKLYRVADMNESSEISLSGDFADYPVSLEQEETSDWDALAETLAVYAERDGRIPLQTAVADASGQVSFQNLTVGLYLVTAERYVSGKDTYTMKSFLVSLPGLDEEETWHYDVNAVAKYEKETEVTDTSLRVHKSWKDSSDSSGRPESIQVQLLRNGKVYDTVELNADNGWSCEWEKLDASFTWSAAEKEVPENYTVSVTISGKTWLLTNTLKTTEPTKIPSKPSTLPQTGMLWWPVPILAAAGLLAVLGGVLLRKKSNDHEE